VKRPKTGAYRRFVIIIRTVINLFAAKVAYAKAMVLHNPVKDLHNSRTFLTARE
jgi:hypothetical protein